MAVYTGIENRNHLLGEIRNTLQGSYDPIEVILSDPTNDTFDFYFGQTKTSTTLASTAVKDAEAIVVTANTGMVIGDTLLLVDTSISPVKYQEVEILNISGTTITTDRRLDYAFASGSIVSVSTEDLAVNGVSTPQVFSAQGGFTIDVTRLIGRMTTDSGPTFNEFGDLAALAKGITLKIVRADGDTRTLWNVKKNEEFGDLAFDLDLYDATSPQAENGLVFRYTLAGTAKHGAVIRLEVGDRLDIEVSDDLTDLQEFKIMYQGHIVEG